MIFPVALKGPSFPETRARIVEVPSSSRSMLSKRAVLFMNSISMNQVLFDSISSPTAPLLLATVFPLILPVMLVLHLKIRQCPKEYL